MSQPDSRRVSFASTTMSPTSTSPAGSVTASTVASRSRTRSKSIMADRPKSMTDFSALMDASMPLFGSKIQARRSTSPKRQERRSPERAAGHSRKKPSMSLAQGLIINGELNAPKSPYRQTHSLGEDQGQSNGVDAGEESLFYAYALKVCK